MAFALEDFYCFTDHPCHNTLQNYKNMCHTWSRTFMLQCNTCQHSLDICATVKCVYHTPADWACTCMYISQMQSKYFTIFTLQYDQNYVQSNIPKAYKLSKTLVQKSVKTVQNILSWISHYWLQCCNSNGTNRYVALKLHSW